MPDWLAILVLILLAALALQILRRARLRRQEKTWLPPELAGATLAYAEQEFRIEQPFPLVARVDRGYLAGGMIYLLELKTRRAPRVYPSDIIELSAQKLALGASGQRVSDTGYVLIQEPGTRRFQITRVRLMDAQRIAALARRRKALLFGDTPPEAARHAGLCRKCAYLAECPSPRVGR